MEEFLNQVVTIKMVLGYFIGYFILCFIKGILKGIKNK